MNGDSNRSKRIVTTPCDRCGAICHAWELAKNRLCPTCKIDRDQKSISAMRRLAAMEDDDAD